MSNNNYTSHFTITASPSAPRDLYAINIQDTFITIIWTAPNMTGERTDISYNITYSNGSFNSMVYSVSDTHHTLTGLIPQTTYTISVISINGVSQQDPDVESRSVRINVTTGKAKCNYMLINYHFDHDCCSLS